MSELSSLFVKIKITKENLENFFTQTPEKSALSDEWMNWWNSRKMYSPEKLQNIPFYNTTNNRIIIEELINHKQTGTVEYFDPASETWILSTVFFSENYYEILPILSWLEKITPFLKEQENGYAMIYDYYWDGIDVMVYADLAFNSFKLSPITNTSEINATILKEVNHTLEQTIEKLSKEYKD
jgi:hypothetical protein